jgi:hypothetical protein
MRANGALANSAQGATGLIPPKILSRPVFPEETSLWTVTGAEKFLKEKEHQSAIMIMDIPYDYLPGWKPSGFTPSSPGWSRTALPKKIKFDASSYKSAVAPGRNGA